MNLEASEVVVAAGVLLGVFLSAAAACSIRGERKAHDAYERGRVDQLDAAVAEGRIRVERSEYESGTSWTYSAVKPLFSISTAEVEVEDSMVLQHQARPRPS